MSQNSRVGTRWEQAEADLVEAAIITALVGGGKNG